MDTMKILIDTSLIIEHFRIKEKDKSFLGYIINKYNLFYISTITEFEILRGIRSGQESATQEILKFFEKLNFDSKVAKIAAEIYIDLKTRSKPIDFPDLIIAATSLEFQLPLATLNVKHYEHIKGIQLIIK
jgi:predicted nucleic acid-binding protein